MFDTRRPRRRALRAAFGSLPSGLPGRLVGAGGATGVKRKRAVAGCRQRERLRESRVVHVLIGFEFRTAFPQAKTLFQESAAGSLTR